MKKIDKVGYVLLPIKTAYRIHRKGYGESCRKYYLMLFTSDKEDMEKIILKIKKSKVKG